MSGPSVQEQIEIIINKLRKKAMPKTKFFFVIFILLCFMVVSWDYAYTVLTGKDSATNNKILESITKLLLIGAILINLISNLLLKYSLNKKKARPHASRHGKSVSSSHHSHVPPSAGGGGKSFKERAHSLQSRIKSKFSALRGSPSQKALQRRKMLNAAENPSNIALNSTCTPISYYINKIGKALFSMSPIYFPVALTLSLIQLIISENSSGNCNSSFDTNILTPVGEFLFKNSRWIIVLAIVFIVIAKFGLLFKNNPIGKSLRYLTHIRDFGYSLIGILISSIIYTVVAIYVLKIFVTNPFVSLINGGQMSNINTNTANKIFSVIFALVATMFCLGSVLKGTAFIRSLVDEGTKLYDTLITPYFGKDGKVTREEYKASSCTINPLELNLRTVSRADKFD